MDARPFTGIPARARTFLRELEANNTLAWFEAHKAEYAREVREPLARLRESLLPGMLRVDPGFEQRAGAGVSRIRRDVRFARDKSPFRTNQWISFRHPGKEWTSRPAFFMEFGTIDARHGMGFYSAGARGMAALRGLAAERPDEYAAAMQKALDAGYALLGEAYKRPRIPAELEDMPPCVRDLHRLRNVHLERLLDWPELLDNAALGGVLAKGFAAAAPLYALWSEAAERAARLQAQAAQRLDDGWD
jgi:uncharacterized protein (TIGR02453 family)